MDNKLNRIRAVVFDWAGTMIDYGSRAPAAVFMEVFRQQGVPITSEQARAPMGMAKRAHIEAISLMPDVATRWIAKFGSEPTQQQIDSMYEEFLPLQKSVLSEHGQLIPGASETARWCREHDIKVGGTTGYTQELMSVVLPMAAEQGYAPDDSLGADDAPAGRPAPWMIFELAKRFDVYPMRHIVKVDDTMVGIEAGLNAGTWTVGVTKTGNELGRSLEEINDLPEEELEQMLLKAKRRFQSAGAHYVVESVAELPAIIAHINQKLSAGEPPALP